MSPNTATALGVGAILLWAALASLTVLKGPVPPFQTTATVFAKGATHGFDDPGRKRQRVAANAVAFADAVKRAQRFFARELEGESRVK